MPTNSINFTIGDGVTQPQVTVTVTDDGNGTFTFNIVQNCSTGMLVGDLRAFYIDWAKFNPTSQPTLAANPNSNNTYLSYGGAGGTHNLNSAQEKSFVQQDIGNNKNAHDVTQVGNQSDTNMNGAAGLAQ